jgi:hypothetical protein
MVAIQEDWSYTGRQRRQVLQGPGEPRAQAAPVSRLICCNGQRNALRLSQIWMSSPTVMQTPLWGGSLAPARIDHTSHTHTHKCCSYS